jgi:acyl phosphate:glycerol-3-phosphate acyltransferase
VQFVGYIVVVLVGYLLGSIPTGFLVARAKGVDIRATGSGNIGATNVFRVVGKGPGIFVLAVDALKGFVACEAVAGLGCWIAGQGFRWLAALDTSPSAEYFPLVGGFAALLGHNYTCWLGFKGGKGIATSAGVLLALFPKALLAVLGVWALIFAVSRYVSLASIAGAFGLPFFVLIFGYSKERFWVSVVMTILAIYKHRTNIRRLMAGTEHRFGDAKTGPKNAAPPTA